MIKSIRYCSEAEARGIRPLPSMAMISITEPGRTAALAEGFGRLIRVQFIDAEFDRSMLKRKSMSAVDLCEKGFPCKERVLEMLAFIDDVQEDDSVTELVVHCHAGQRRSAAVALFVAERYGLPQYMAYDKGNKTVYNLLRDPWMFDSGVKKVTLLSGLSRYLGRR